MAKRVWMVGSSNAGYHEGIHEKGASCAIYPKCRVATEGEIAVARHGYPEMEFMQLKNLPLTRSNTYPNKALVIKFKGRAEPFVLPITKKAWDGFQKLGLSEEG